MVRTGPRVRQACRYALVAAGVALLQACGSPTEPTPPWPPPPPPAVLAITCPAAASGVSHFNQPVAVAWSAPTTSGGTAPVATTCTPSSGSTFTAGSTTVVCLATDAGMQTGFCSFQVTIVRPPEIAATRFLAFGDSLTEGAQSPAPTFLVVVPNEAYPFRLNILMSARYEDQAIVVDNEGQGGEWISDGLARLPGVLTARNPQVLLLLDGANDLLNDVGIAVPRIIDRLQNMVRLAKGRGITVLLANFPPQRAGAQRGAGAPFVPSLNSQIADLARREGATLVDLYGGFPADTTQVIGVDGLHPTADGFYLMAQIFAQVIKTSLEKPLAGLPLSVR